jgi:hypothetical protein
MAATAWTLYNEAKKYIANGTIQLGTSALKLKLCTSASNASTRTLSTFASVNSEIAATGGYVANGKALTGVTLTAGASAQQIRFDSDDLVFTASGASLTNVKFAVIGVSAGKALCWSRLSAAQFTVTSPNTLTIQMNAAGIFYLV